ncbi:hypothetical protein ACFE04_021495 [Oxalis oulophora]
MHKKSLDICFGIRAQPSPRGEKKGSNALKRSRLPSSNIIIVIKLEVEIETTYALSTKPNEWRKMEINHSPHHAHVLDQLGPVPGHTESAEDEARVLHQADRRHQDRRRVGSVAGRLHVGKDEFSRQSRLLHGEHYILERAHEFPSVPFKGDGGYVDHTTLSTRKKNFTAMPVLQKQNRLITECCSVTEHQPLTQDNDEIGKV